MPTQHAFCSASASHRWLNCTAAPTFEAQFPDGDAGVYANEGTLAHKICETTVLYNSGQLSKRTYNSRIKKCKEDELFKDEMLKTAEIYAGYIWELSMSYDAKPYQATEVRVDFSDYVPEGFGTCDCCLVGTDVLNIVDYKHGKGVPVSAENNSQMRLYALGALKQYGMFYPLKKVRMSIVQPRITEEPSWEELTVEELLAWGEQIKPIAQKAYTGEGAEFREGTWCRFCKGKAVCRARAENMTALEDFADLPVMGKMTEQEKLDRTSAEIMGFPVKHILTDAEIGDLLQRGARLVKWYEDLQDYALNAILDGKTVPGWKVVEGRSVRAWDNAEEAFKDIVKAGYDEAMLYERKAKSLSELEKMFGKKVFAEIAGKHVVKPAGKPTLVDAGDSRADFSPAAADFKGVDKA